MTELTLKSVQDVVTTGLSTKASAEDLTAANETITAQAVEIKELTAVVEEVKNLAGNLEQKHLALETSNAATAVDAPFDVKGANLALKEAILMSTKSGVPLNIKTVNTGADGMGVDGAIAEELGRTVLERARENVTILGLVASKNVGSVDYREMILVAFPTSSTGSEQTGNPAVAWDTTAGQKYENIAMNVGKQYAKPQISREAINDPHIDIFGHLQTLLAEEISRYWAGQVLFGDNGGSDNLRGILGPQRFDSVQSLKATFGASPRGVEFYPLMKTGIADSIGDRDPLAPNSAVDNIIDLTAFLPSKYLKDAKFIMNRFVFAEYRKLKDNLGRPLIIREEGMFMMEGFPVVMEDYMQAEAGSLKAPVIFGDLKRAYALLSIDDYFLVDPYSADGAVTLKYESRKGDMIQQNDAIVILNTAT